MTKPYFWLPDKPLIWTCKIGVMRDKLPRLMAKGADSPMRRAVEHSFKKVTSVEEDFHFSGWAGGLEIAEIPVAYPEYPIPKTGIEQALIDFEIKRLRDLGILDKLIQQAKEDKLLGLI